MTERNHIQHAYGAVVLLRLLPPWLALSRPERNAKAAELFDISSRYSKDVTMRWFDADALGSGFSDWVMCEFSNLDRYHSLWEELRDTEFFFKPYAEIAQVILGIENGYQRFENGDM